ncbi:MAG: enoyl-CoA hydratase/isomerase family protein [Chloroflexi bacterium]|nr:enoyl-CoA hydratase/isomerase family protein [Chloroflexota bacterium]
MSEQPPTVLLEKRDDIAVVTLNRPDVVNAFSVRMRDELWEVLAAVRDDPDVRGMLLVGAGERGFCAGADLTEFGTAPSQTIARQVRWERDLWGLLLGIPKPTVAAIHGYCLGSGLEMAALCDVRVAADDAVFGMPEAGLGLVPAAGGTQLLPRLLGPGRAIELLLSGRRFGAEDALAYGLVSEVVPRSELVAAATALLRRVLRAPAPALAAAKRAIADGADMPLAAALDLERRLAASLSA